MLMNTLLVLFKHDAINTKNVRHNVHARVSTRTLLHDDGGNDSMMTMMMTMIGTAMMTKTMMTIMKFIK